MNDLILNGELENVVIKHCSDQFELDYAESGSRCYFNKFLMQIVEKGSDSGIIGLFCERIGSIWFFNKYKSLINNYFSVYSRDDLYMRYLYDNNSFDHDDYLFLSEGNQELLVFWVFRQVVYDVLNHNEITR